MSILKTPEEYAKLIRDCYHGREAQEKGVFEAAQAHSSISASYWLAVFKAL